MLFSLVPHSLVNFTVWTFHVAFPFALVVFPLAIVLGAIGPAHSTLTLTFVSLPHSSVGRKIFCDDFSVTMALILDPLSRKLSAIWPSHLAISVACPEEPRAFIEATIRPAILSFASALVLLPLTLVLGITRPLHRALPLPHVVNEGTRIFYAISIKHHAGTMTLTIHPGAIILFVFLVRPVHRSLTIT